MFEQGTGRIAVDRVIEQTVVANTPSVNSVRKRGRTRSDKPVAKSITYRNLGTKDLTLALTETATDPRGNPVPSGFFTFGTRKITIRRATSASRYTGSQRTGPTPKFVARDATFHT